MKRVGDTSQCALPMINDKRLKLQKIISKYRTPFDRKENMVDTPRMHAGNLKKLESSSKFNNTITLVKGHLNETKVKKRDSPKGIQTSRECISRLRIARKNSIHNKTKESPLKYTKCTTRKHSNTNFGRSSKLKELKINENERETIQANKSLLHQKGILKKIIDSTNKNQDIDPNSKCGSKITLELPDDSNFNKMISFMQELKNSIEVPAQTSRAKIECVSQNITLENKENYPTSLYLQPSTCRNKNYIDTKNEDCRITNKSTTKKIIKKRQQIQINQEKLKLNVTAKSTHTTEHSIIEALLNKKEGKFCNIVINNQEDKENKNSNTEEKKGEFNFSILREQLNIKNGEQISLFPILNTHLAFAQQLKFFVTGINFIVDEIQNPIQYL